MKFIETKKSKLDNHETVYTFTVGKQELELLYAMVSIAKKNTPRVIGTIPTIGRLRNFQKVIGHVLKEYK